MSGITRHRVLTLGTGLLIAVVGLEATGCTESGAVPEMQPPAGSVATNVEVMVVRPKPFTERSMLSGVIAADRDLTLSSEAGGLVEKSRVEVGDWVAKGSILANINSEVIENQLRQAIADSGFKSREALRTDRMFGSGSVTEREKDAVRLAEVVATVAAKQARIRFRRSIIRAPFKAVIAKRFVEEGQIAAPGQPLFRIISGGGKVRTQIYIPERDVFYFQVGKPVALTFGAIPGRTFDGRVLFVSPAAGGSRSFEGQIVVKNPDGILRPGFIGNVEVVRRELTAALVVPAGSILDTAHGKAVFVAEDSVAQMRPVSISMSSGDLAVIDGGINEGESLVTVGHRKLVDGSPIRILATHDESATADELEPASVTTAVDTTST